MNRRLVVLAAGALAALLAPLRAENPTTDRAARAPSQTQTQPQSRADDRNDAQEAPTRQTSPPEQSRSTDSEGKSWTFDQALYTNNRTTGARVWQYAKKKPAYRDPYSFLDSPHEAYPFGPDPYFGPYYSPFMNYGLYPYSPYTHPYPDGPMPYTPE